MSSIFILKPIIDRLHEEMAEYNKKVEDYTVKIAKQSQEIDEKNRLIAKLSEECKKLESLLAGYEANFDLLTNKEERMDDIDVPSLPPQKLNTVHESVHDPVVVKEGEAEDVKQNETKSVDVKVKKDRRDYMREYQRNYRKKQKEVTLSL